MKAKLFATFALVAAVATSVSAFVPAKSTRPVASNSPVNGDYVEARTASVFAGACHYNGELVTTGRDALLAWSFADGSYNGVDMAGVKAVAEVTAEENLGLDGVAHKTELAIDSAATPAQVAALTALLKSKVGSELGTITTVRLTPISFSRTSDGYLVIARDFASLTVHPRPDNACCIQPHLVWYNPLSPTDMRKVGYTEEATYNGGIADPWSRHGEDSAFYGPFTF